MQFETNNNKVDLNYYLSGNPAGSDQEKDYLRRTGKRSSTALMELKLKSMRGETLLTLVNAGFKSIS
ncbi:MAG: hypothetical protein U0936_03305 [Planctomycetaceae bacterium]